MDSIVEDMNELESASSSPSNLQAYPIFLNQIEELFEMQNFNGFLPCYVYQIHFTANKNTTPNDMDGQMYTTETTDIKALFESELAAVRIALDEISNEKARIDIESQRLLDENTALKNRNTVLESDIVNLKKNVKDLQHNLERETLTRVESQNTAITLREELTFNAQIHAQEMKDMHVRISKEIVELESHLRNAKQSNFLKSLKQLRNQYMSQLRKNQNVIQALYDTKIKYLQNDIIRANDSATAATKEISKVQSQIPTLNEKIDHLEGKNKSYRERIRELEETIDKQLGIHGENEGVIHRLRRSGSTTTKLSRSYGSQSHNGLGNRSV
ncbi:lamin-C-like [Contarinia nasturtii]|uniref:lamin-C-like n=1 Tax=Contarinia nasturtii TaxID=265458 RepID=UPI0012D3EE5C|nr:lamin-C-like [Contarinia nasturtii]